MARSSLPSYAPEALNKPVTHDTVDLSGAADQLMRQALPFPRSPQRRAPTPSPSPPAAAAAPAVAAPAPALPVPTAPPPAAAVAARAPTPVRANSPQHASPGPSSPRQSAPRQSAPRQSAPRQPLPSWYTPDHRARAAAPARADWAPPAPVHAPNPIAEQRGPVSVPAPTPSVPSEPAPPSPGPAELDEDRSLIQLLWFQPTVVPQMRRVPEWAELLVQAAEEDGGVQDDGYLDEDDALEQDDRHDVSEILVRGNAVDLHHARQSLIDASRKSGRLVTPLVLLEGVLRCEFDEIARLEIALGATTPMTAHNDKLRDAVAAAEAFVAGAGASPVPALAQAHTNSLGRAIGKEDIRTTVDAHVRRTLVEKRAFKKRKLLGQTFVRAALRCDDPVGETPQSAVVYIPEKVASLLPLFERIPVRLIGEFTPKQEQAESAAYAVKLAVVARLVTLD